MIGVDGVAREVKEMYIGVDGVAHKVKTGFIGVDGVARVFFGGYYQPAINEVVLTMNSGATFAPDTKYAPGTYEIQIAGAPNTNSGYSTQNCFTIQTTMTEIFQIVAVTSTDATDSFLQGLGISSAAGTIFGGRGGKSAGISGGSVTPWQQGCLTWGGACCHFLPIDGVFGTNYLRCFHCGAPASGVYGGAGAYGGGAGGRGARTYNAATGGYFNSTGATGISGAGGSGGAGGNGTTSGNPGTGDAGRPGNSGSGIGAGTATVGGVAWFDGSTWRAPSRSSNASGTAYINIIYRARP